MENWENLNLKKSSIFDLTDDLDLIEEITTCRDKNKYLRIAGWPYRDMIAFAEETQNDKLLKALERTFKTELELLFNE